jgi:hypothetical protein
MAIIDFFALYKQKIIGYPIRHYITKLVLNDSIKGQAMPQKIDVAFPELPDKYRILMLALKGQPL